MLFPTVDYGLFFLVVFTGAWALRRFHSAHKLLLLLASYFFYGYWDWRFVPLLAGISFIGWLSAALMPSPHRSGLDFRSPTIGNPTQLGGGARRRLSLVLGITLCLGTLATFKYLGFATQIALEAMHRLGIDPGQPRLPEFALPVGVSFFTFHAISLIVDAWRGKIAVKVRLLDSLLYVAFFPQLVAGPILRASDFLPQLASPPSPEKLEVPRAIELLVLGLIKKVLIAQFLQTELVDPVFDNPPGHSSLEVLFAVYGYAVQIYCDFSGYSDMAVGSALLLGYRMPDNFDAPYLATSPQDFWRRWHISLSTWLRDYLFIPLGGSRHGAFRLGLALALTMLLGGLWHGAAWNFVAWGALHGLALIVHRIWASTSASKRLSASTLWNIFSAVLTFHVVCAGWILFRASSLTTAGELFTALGSGVGAHTLSLGVVLLIALGIFGQLVTEPVRVFIRTGYSRLPVLAQGFVFAFAVMAIEAIGPRGIAPFIYFRF